MSLPLADESVDLVVTSPPYFALRSYTDGGEHYEGQIGSEATPQEFLEALWAVTAECVRVLKPSGSMFVNLGDKYSGVNPGSFRRHTQPLPGLGVRVLTATATSEATADHRPDFGGTPAKSLMGLPWRYAIGCIDQLGLILRAEVIWSKPNGLPESVTDRVRRSHEQWFHFTKEPRYFSAVDEVREPHTATDRPNFDGSYGTTPKAARASTSLAQDVDRCGNNPLGKLPGSVWQIPTEPLRVPDHLGVDHFAAFPSEWPRRIILGWSPSGVCVACGEGRRPVVAKEMVVNGMNTGWRKNDPTLNKNHSIEGGYPHMTTHATITGYVCACPDTTAPTTPAVVLDPFCGTGTTPAVAHALGRHGIGIDLSADYLRLAEWRCNDPGLRSKVLRVDKPKPVPDGQLDIFGGEAA